MIVDMATEPNVHGKKHRKVHVKRRMFLLAVLVALI